MQGANPDEKQDNEEVMINTPEGFDARTYCFIKLCLTGINRKPATRSN